MFRTRDLQYFEDDINEWLNDPEYKLLQLNVACSEETTYTPVTLRFQKVAEPQERRYERYLKHFVVSEETQPHIDDYLNDSTKRLIKLYNFPTAEGTVVVIDYQVRKRKVG